MIMEEKKNNLTSAIDRDDTDWSDLVSENRSEVEDTSLKSL